MSAIITMEVRLSGFPRDTAAPMPFGVMGRSSFSRCARCRTRPMIDEWKARSHPQRTRSQTSIPAGEVYSAECRILASQRRSIRSMRDLVGDYASAGSFCSFRPAPCLSSRAPAATRVRGVASALAKPASGFRGRLRRCTISSGRKPNEPLNRSAGGTRMTRSPDRSDHRRHSRAKAIIPSRLMQTLSSVSS